MDVFDYRVQVLGMDFSEGAFTESLERALPRRLHRQPFTLLPDRRPPPPVTETRYVTVAEKRLIENLELERNLLHCAEMQIIKRCDGNFMSWLIRSTIFEFALINTVFQGEVFLSGELMRYVLLAFVVVAFFTEIQSEEFASLLNLKRMRPHISAIRMRRNTLTNIVGDLRNQLSEPYNGVLLSPSDATIEIHSARFRVNRLEDLLYGIEGFDDSWGLMSGVASLTFVVAIIFFAVVFLIASF